MPARDGRLHAARRTGKRDRGGTRDARRQLASGGGTMTPAVAAIVLASRGGARLARALDAVAWAGERLVLDPAGRLATATLPDGVAVASDPIASAKAPWVLVLEERETVPVGLAAEIADAIAAPDVVAYRVAQETRGFDLALRLRHASVRLARRAGARIEVLDALGLEIRPAAGRIGHLSAALVADSADSIAGVVDDLDADAAAYAALLRAGDVRPRLRHLACTPLGPAGRTLVARGGWRRPAARWMLAVFDGYRVATAYAKLWELRRAEAAATR
jgi:hypothetical protein